MRKWIATLLTFLLLMGMAIPAGAEGAPSAVLTETGYKSISWVPDGTVLQEYDGSGNSYLYSITGELLTEAIYSNFWGVGQLIQARLNALDSVNSYGALDQSGQVQIPFQYGALEARGQKWVLALALTPSDSEGDRQVNGAPYDIARVDVYYVNGSARLVGKLDRSQYVASKDFNDYINIQARDTEIVSTYSSDFELLGTGMTSIWDQTYVPRNDGVWEEDDGFCLTDAAGDVILLQDYESVERFRAGYAAVLRDGLWGMIDENGTEVVPPEFDEIIWFSDTPRNEAHAWGNSMVSYGYAALRRGEEICFADLANGNVWNTGYTLDDMTASNASGLVWGDDYCVHILAADGTNTTLSKLNAITIETGGWDIDVASHTCGFFWTLISENGRKGLIDWHGNEVIPCEYDKLDISVDGQYALAKRDAGENGTVYGIYRLIYPTPEPKAEPESTATQELEPESEPTATQEPEPEIDSTAIRTLLSGAKELLELNAIVNRDAAVTLLNRALELMGESDTAQRSMIEVAVQALEADVKANTKVAIRLLDEVLALLD